MTDDVDSAQFESQQEAAPATSSYGADFEKKISEARAKRAEVLSAREAARKSNPRAKGKEASFGSTRRNKLTGTRAAPNEPSDTPLLSLTGENAVRAVLVFAGGAGFGLGAVLGLGILIGMGLPSQRETPEIAFVQPSKLEAQPQIVESEIDVVQNEASYFAEAAPEMEIVAIPVSYDMLDVSLPVPSGVLDKELEPVLEPIATVSLPTFSDVSYMQSDLERDETLDVDATQDVADTVQPTVESEPEAPRREALFFMHAPDGLSDAQLQNYVSMVEQAGADVVEVGRERFRVSTTHLRYYSPHTAETAMDVAREMGIEARDFSDNVHKNARVEVWVAGRPKGNESEKQTARGLFSWLNGERVER